MLKNPIYHPVVKQIEMRFLLPLLMIVHMPGVSQSGSEGYYKDIFMDGGVNLYNKTELPAADELGLSMEFIATGEENIQNDKIVGNDYDDNGVLLYPDGEPRFRLLHTNGGSATSHGTSLGEEGINNIRSFYSSGGSYTGVCAGAFITSLHYQPSGTNPSYYHIWPGRTTGTGVIDTYTGHFIESDSPLLQYSNFGDDLYIDQIYHTGGCYANENIDFPPQTEILLRFDHPGYNMHNKVSCWAYKADESSGRCAVIGSHPEELTSGEGLELMEALLLHALSGQGNINIKGTLENGTTRIMDKFSGDNDPDFTRIGDKQYHHFALEIPFAATQLSIAVVAEPGYHINVFCNPNEPAFRSNAVYADTSVASEKTIIAEQISAGQYFVSVECETTVYAIPRNWGYEYVDNLDVLNGVAYSIQADYTQASANNGIPSCNVPEVYPNPATEYIKVGIDNEIDYIQLSDITGKTILKLIPDKSKSEYTIDLKQLKNGIYIISTKSHEHSSHVKIIKQ